YVYFFFSSRRRHTRFSRDWSSDVCSSDLRRFDKYEFCVRTHCLFQRRQVGCVHKVENDLVPAENFVKKPKRAAVSIIAQNDVVRSEERRVGKEVRDGRSRYHQRREDKEIG